MGNTRIWSEVFKRPLTLKGRFNQKSKVLLHKKTSRASDLCEALRAVRCGRRRRKWLEEEKCIVLLTDDDLCEMVHLREASEQPFDVIDAHLEDFFRTLTP